MEYIKNGLDKETAYSTTTHLAIGAHQDDTEIMAPSGIIECFNNSSKNFSCIVLTDGKNSARSGIYENMSDEEMGKIRIKEQNKAAMIGDYNFVLEGGFSSKYVKDKKNKEVEELIYQALIKVKPEVIYLHNPFDKHKTHVASMKHAINAIRRLDKEIMPKNIYGMEVWRGLDWLSDEEKVVFELNDHENILEALIKVHDSQINGGKRYDIAIMGRRYSNATFYQSHEVDVCNMMAYGIDLNPLVKAKKLDYKKFIKEHTDAFIKEVMDNYLNFF